jgi:hypothetical protein
MFFIFQYNTSLWGNWAGKLTLFQLFDLTTMLYFLSIANKS